MVFFIVRGFSLGCIALMTGTLWLQQHTKKVIVVRNTTQAVFKKDTPQIGPVTVKQDEKKGVIEIYKQTSENKSQKLAYKHLMFGALSLAGAILMPKLYFLLSIAYFAAYQIYYFALSGLQFTPIWTAFMAVGGGLIAGKFLKLIA